MLLPSGRIRQYSLCGDPADQSVYRIAVRRILSRGGGSIEITTISGWVICCRSGVPQRLPLVLPVSPTVVTRRPSNAVRGGWHRDHPILPMLSHAERLGYDWSAIYTGRSRASIPFLRELEGYGDRITVRTDDEDGLPDADGLVGPLDGERPIVLYCCGPIPMIDLLRAHLDGRGDVELHYERFSPPPVVGGSEFAVSLARSGVSTTVGADESPGRPSPGVSRRPLLVSTGLLRHLPVTCRRR